MQALSMIDTSVNSQETVVSAKPAEPQGNKFGRVLTEQRQPEKTQPAEARQSAEAKPQPAVQQEVKPEQSPAQPQVAQPQEQVQKQVPVEGVVDAGPKLQQTIVSLMKVMSGGETPELVEEFGSTEELLSQLVQQLEGTEPKDEQVLAGIDLSALVEQLQELATEGSEEPLAQSVVQIEEQLANQEGLLKNAELAASLLPTTDPQAIAPKLAETLAQARQVLQQAIDSVAPKNTVVTETVVVAEAQVVGESLLPGDGTAEPIDPRFAGLLKPRSEQQMQQPQSLRQQVQGDSAKPNAGEAAQLITAVAPEQTETAEVAELLGTAPKQGLENLLQQAQAQPTVAPQTQNSAGKVLPTTPMMQLPSGQQVAESQVFDQVVARFSSGLNGEEKRMVLRMQPAELGSLKIELLVEGDRIRANILAQSQQVQEVLERNLPQLRNALAEQGLKIDQFRVDVNQDQSQQDQFDQLAQQQQQRNGSQSQPGWQQPRETEEQIIPVAHLMQNGGGGISLHV